MQPKTIAFLGFSYTSGTAMRFNAGPTQQDEVKISLWAPMVFFALYPAFVVVVAPFRRSHRYYRRRCPKCSYSMVGNTSGVCSECGEQTSTRVVPRWERVLIALLGGLIASSIVEFIFTQTAFEHRAVVWMLREFGFSDGAWIIPSMLRTACIGSTAIAIYAYLSPERFYEDGDDTERQEANLP
jgi:hypothetical protein